MDSEQYYARLKALEQEEADGGLIYNDACELAVFYILKNLRGRSGLDAALSDLDPDTRLEMVNTLSDILRKTIFPDGY